MKDNDITKGAVDHVEESGIAISRNAFIQAQQDSLGEGRPQWPVIKENLRCCLTMIIVQVRILFLLLLQVAYYVLFSSQQ